MQYLSFCDWLISLNILLSNFIHFVENYRISFFLWINNIPLCVTLCIYLMPTFKMMMFAPCCLKEASDVSAQESQQPSCQGIIFHFSLLLYWSRKENEHVPGVVTRKARICFHMSSYDSRGSQEETLQVKEKVDRKCCRIFMLQDVSGLPHH
jgi:hypothetical protein